jgi:hypothetical protein
MYSYTTSGRTAEQVLTPDETPDFFSEIYLLRPALKLTH